MMLGLRGEEGDVGRGRSGRCGLVDGGMMAPERVCDGQSDGLVVLVKSFMCRA